MKQITALKRIAAALNKGKVAWALGASIMLYFHGLVDKPNDIDIMVIPEDISKADSILSRLGSKYEKGDSDNYSTRFFAEYSVDGTDVDLMAGFRINLPNIIYEYEITGISPVEHFILDGTLVPLSPVEDWYLLYQLMPGRGEKVNITETHLIRNGIKYPDRLKAALDMNIPDAIKNRIKNLLK